MSTANLRVEDRSAIAAVNDLSLAEAAEAYASAGIPVLPLKPRDKLPLTPHGHLDATTDIQKIREWWERWTNANIGIVPGDNAGFLVIDIDGPEGAQTLTKLEAMHSALPATLTSQTARGRHLLYANPNGLKAGNAALGPKVDVRSNSGYIVAPPSIHPSGHRYQWMADVLIAPIPKWLRTVLANKSAPAATQTGDGQILILPEQRKIAEGGRNAALASIAGRLRQDGCTPDAMLAALMNINEQRCDPPLPPREVERIAKSISRYPISAAHGCSDLGNAKRFVELHGDDVRFTSRIGRWFCWTGNAWQEVHEDEIMRKAFEVPAAIALEAANASDPDLQKALRTHARKTESRKYLRDMIDLAGKLLSVAEDKLDENPFLLAVANGTIDLRSGELRQSRREDFMTKSLSVEYDRNATAPRWIEFVEEITQGDIALAEFLQRLLGYCLTGDTSEQCLFILHGHGANGKSTLLEVVHELLGPYSAKTP
jgi:putative DNA primase/helicase